MRPDYEGVVYYSDDDMSLGENFEKAKIIADSFDENRKISDINEVMELYDVYRIITSPGIKVEYTEPYRSKAKMIMATVARYFATITDDSIMDIYSAVSYDYIDVFWLLMDKFQVYKRISETVFLSMLNHPETSLYMVLRYKDIVTHYDGILSEYMRHSTQSARILVGKFLERRDREDDCIEIPAALRPNEFECIFQDYIDTERPNVGVLELIASSQSTSECPISDMLRLKAKQKASDLLNSGQINVTDFSCAIGIEFCDNKEIKSYTQTEPFGFKITYDINWIIDNMDYPTLLNNFIYLFEYTDMHFRCNFVSVLSQLGVFERTLGIKGKKEYETGIAFQMENTKSSAEMALYNSFLIEHDIRIEDIIKWFFTEYLEKEFKVEGFVINMPSASSSPLEKCRSLLSEMDGILKQYNLYAKYHSIDRSLLEMSSNPIVFSELPSMIKNKYAYLQGNNLKKELYLLFSDQCLLNYDYGRRIGERSFFDLVRKHNMHISDYPNYAQNDLSWLKERGTIIVDKDNLIRFNIHRVLLLKDLYDHEVICTSYWKKDLIDQLVASGDLRYGSSLFSEPEQKYLNYMLNKKEYSNGLDLRNRYIHGSNTLEEQQHQIDYITILKLMIVVVIKINEEFCLVNPENPNVDATNEE